MKSPISVNLWRIGLSIVLLHELPRENSSAYGIATSREASGTQPKKPREVCRLTSEGKIHLFRVVILRLLWDFWRFPVASKHYAYLFLVLVL